MIVTLAEMKTYLRVSGTQDDAFLTQQLQMISDTVENYCRIKVNAANYVQTFYWDDYESSREMTLFLYPLISVTSVVEDGATLTDYRINKPTGILTRKQGFFRGQETLVTYRAGYEAGSVPSPLMEVVFSLVKERYNKFKSGISLDFGSDVQRVSIPGAISIDFDYSLVNNDRKISFGTILGNYVNVLDFYRSERAILGSGKLIYL